MHPMHGCESAGESDGLEIDAWQRGDHSGEAMSIMPLLRSSLLAWIVFIPWLTFLAAAASAADRIPVLAWGGPPEAETTDERYRQLAEAGFTHNYSGFSSIASMAKALDI